PLRRGVGAAMAAGRSGLLHATTGSGKTYAVWFGALARAAAIGAAAQASHAPSLGVLWITPVRALAADYAARRPVGGVRGAARRHRLRPLERRHPHRRHLARRAGQAGPALSDRADH